MCHVYNGDGRKGEMAMPRKPGSKALWCSTTGASDRIRSVRAAVHRTGCVDLMRRGCRPREAWRSACEPTQDEAAVRLNQVRGTRIFACTTVRFASRKIAYGVQKTRAQLLTRGFSVLIMQRFILVDGIEGALIKHDSATRGVDR